MWNNFKHFMGISIHALREEGDPLGTCNADRIDIFLSTPSARRATRGVGRAGARQKISIHALREEGDVRSSRCPVPRW